MEQKWRVNILALIGAFTGFIAIFSGWMNGDMLIGLNLLIVMVAVNDTLIILACILFIAGTLTAFFCPIGGFIQIAGIVSYFIGFAVFSEKLPTTMGPYLAIISAIMIVFSLIKPQGLNYDLKPVDLKGRIFTFSKEPLPSPSSISRI
jgi:hypothetical protein